MAIIGRIGTESIRITCLTCLDITITVYFGNSVVEFYINSVKCDRKKCRKHRNYKQFK